MAKSNKNTGPEARLPKGFLDTPPEDVRATHRMLETIRQVYERYGFEPLETPAIEYTDALGKFLPDLDRPNEGVFSFQDEDEQWLSLRYDLTAPLARYVAEGLKEQKLALPFRRYAVGPVWRNEKPGPGRFRQFTQFDADTVGTDNIAADAEICMLAADTLEALGIKRGDYVIKVNNRKVLDGVMEAIGLGGEAQCAMRLTVLRALDKYDRLGRRTASAALLGEGRKDESGDFTKGAELDAVRIDRVLSFSSMSECSVERSQRQGNCSRVKLMNLDRDAGSAKSGTSLRRRQGSDELETDRSAGLRAAGYGDGPHSHRPLSRPRPRVLHRPRVRGRDHLPRHQRGRPDRALRLGRRRRPLRRPGRALPRPEGAGHRLLHRRLAPAGRARRHQQGQARRSRRPRRRARHGEGPPRRLPEDGAVAARWPASAPRCTSAPPA